MNRPLLYVTIAFMAVVARADDIRLSSRQVSTRDGLPGNTINEMVQSADGYIWMATNNGLSRYDGYATVNYATVGCSVDDGGEAERIGRKFHVAVSAHVVLREDERAA